MIEQMRISLLNRSGFKRSAKTRGQSMYATNGPYQRREAFEEGYFVYV